MFVDGYCDSTCEWILSHGGEVLLDSFRIPGTLLKAAIIARERRLQGKSY